MAEKSGLKQGLGVGIGLGLGTVLFSYMSDEPINWVRAIGLMVIAVILFSAYEKFKK